MATTLRNMLLGKAFVAVEFFMLEKKEQIAFLKVESKRNELAIVESDTLNNIEELVTHKTGGPVALVINNDQVIQKEITDVDPSDKKLLHKAFPNLRYEEFYYQIWRCDHMSVIALCRRSYVQELISKTKGFFKVAAVSLGTTPLSVLTGFGLPEVIATSTHSIHLNRSEGLLVPQPAIGEKYIINGLEISDAQLLGFAGALGFLMPPGTTGNIAELNGELDRNFMQDAFFNKGLKAVIVLLLSLLVINFLLFSYYFDKASQVSETVSTNKVDIENAAKLKKRIKEKQERFSALNGSAGAASSAVINDLVKDMPTSILLTEITYHPLEKKVKENEPITTRDSLILVSGTTLSNDAFTGWMENIEKNKWVKGTTITAFGKDQENNTGFSVNIMVNK